MNKPTCFYLDPFRCRRSFAWMLGQETDAHRLVDGRFETYDGIVRNNVVIGSTWACRATSSSSGTHPLRLGTSSPARSAAGKDTSAEVPVDRVGVKRPLNGKIEVGAYEY